MIAVTLRTVYTVTPRAGAPCVYTPVGRATVGADGGVVLHLDALPAAGGVLVIAGADGRVPPVPAGGAQ